MEVLKLWLGTMDQLLERITFKSGSAAENPLIRGLEVSVAMVLDALAQGASPQDVVARYPALEPDDIRAACLYASRLILHIPALPKLVEDSSQQIAIPTSAVAVQPNQALDPLDFDPEEVPVWQIAANISATVSDELWAKLPSDLSQNFDDYQEQWSKPE
ncbi:MAG: DUF433 domain-containing protein [Cyanobacteria bacterium P01_H01_bin.21]